MTESYFEAIINLCPRTAAPTGCCPTHNDSVVTDNKGQRGPLPSVAVQRQIPLN